MRFKDNVEKCVCDNGIIRVAYDDLGDGQYGIYEFHCRCSYPSGVHYLFLCDGDKTKRFYSRPYDYAGPWTKKIRMHPKNMGKYFKELGRKLAQQQAPAKAAGNIMDELPF